MQLFISYRRRDSLHAAHRVRMYLQQKFGHDSIYIDQEIPPGMRWEDHLQEMLSQCDGVVALIGDEFLQCLKPNKGDAPTEFDPMVWEIASAIRTGKPVFPVLFGKLDMPTSEQLPLEIQNLPQFQAVFAREPAFDVGMEVLVKGIRNTFGVDYQLTTSENQPSYTNRGISGLPLLYWTCILIFGSWFCGQIEMKLNPQTPPMTDVHFYATWLGFKYVLITSILGLCPYLSFWIVSILRARVSLPTRSIAAFLNMLNVGGACISSTLFLLCSSIPGWRLSPHLPASIFPSRPSLWHYFGLAVALLLVVLVAAVVVLIEPQARRLKGRMRDITLVALNWGSMFVFGSLLWFIGSLVISFPVGVASVEVDQIAWLGYFSLVPTLSIIYVMCFRFGKSQLLSAAQSWEWRFLFGASLGLYFVTTLTLYSLGVGIALSCLSCVN